MNKARHFDQSTRSVRSGEICINKTDVSTKFILSVVERPDMRIRFTLNPHNN